MLRLRYVHVCAKNPHELAWTWTHVGSLQSHSAFKHMRKARIETIVDDIGRCCKCAFKSRIMLGRIAKQLRGNANLKSLVFVFDQRPLSFSKETTLRDFLLKYFIIRAVRPLKKRDMAIKVMVYRETGVSEVEVRQVKDVLAAIQASISAMIDVCMCSSALDV